MKVRKHRLKGLKLCMASIIVCLGEWCFLKDCKKVDGVPRFCNFIDVLLIFFLLISFFELNIWAITLMSTFTKLKQLCFLLGSVEFLPQFFKALT